MKGKHPTDGKPAQTEAGTAPAKRSPNPNGQPTLHIPTDHQKAAVSKDGILYYADAHGSIYRVAP